MKSYKNCNPKATAKFQNFPKKTQLLLKITVCSAQATVTVYTLHLANDAIKA